MDNNNHARPDLSDVTVFAPEIDFPQWEEDQRYVVAPLSSQVEPARSVLAVTQKTESYLAEVLSAWYPVKAARLDEINLQLSSLAHKIIGSPFPEATEEDYSKMQEEYAQLREFLSSLEGLEEEDSHQEE